MNLKERFRGVDATHVPAVGPASQPRRVHLRRSPEAVGFPNAIDRVGGPFLGRIPLEDGPRSEYRLQAGKTLLIRLSFGGSEDSNPRKRGTPNRAFLLPASSACARSLLVPGTCDLTPRRTDASDSTAPGVWSSPTIPAP